MDRKEFGRQLARVQSELDQTWSMAEHALRHDDNYRELYGIMMKLQPREGVTAKELIEALTESEAAWAADFACLAIREAWARAVQHHIEEGCDNPACPAYRGNIT